ncbi:hypothetical protein CWI37_1500p0010 [Hamiltosporidium tvaerminnensis]|uniref:Protein kinase n=1 Tax=Hamiltosporidium tvaerminnensis TaxID=1176355 RepID=A0A4Q9KWK6_9MICR|nr:hypothetical protein CWI37_1500p0010 [Hamiltosporidium tvaerminnensis]
MFIFKKVINTKNIFTTKKEKIHSTNKYDIYHSTINNQECSIFEYKKEKNYKNKIQENGKACKKQNKEFIDKIKKASDLLKNIKHINIIDVIKVSESKENIILYSKKVIPFLFIYTNELNEFNNYVLYKIGLVLDFLHEKCKISHNNIIIESLYVDFNGNIILGDFEEFSGAEMCSMNDDYMFKELVYKIKKSENIKNNEFSIKGYLNINEERFDKNFYKKFEMNFIKLNILKEFEKYEFIDWIIQNINELIEIYKKIIINFFVNELFKEYKVEYKMRVIKFVFELKIIEYEEYIEQIFSVLDSNIRLFILKNVDGRQIKNWTSNTINNISLGIKCNDNNLRRESINFIGKILYNLNDKNIKVVLKAMSCVTDKEIMKYILQFLNENIDILKSRNEDILKDIYKLVMTYISCEEVRKELLVTIEIYFKYFKLRKIYIELLPIICTMLGDEAIQDSVFDLIENILKFMKENKKELLVKNWNVKSIKGFFGFMKGNKEEKSSKNLTVINKKVIDEGILEKKVANISFQDKEKYNEEDEDVSNEWNEEW